MSVHVPVLMDKVISSLDLHASDVVFDGTINGGGHSLEIVKYLSDSGILIGVDVDRVAIESSKKKFRESRAQVNLICDNFRNIDTIVDNLELNYVDKILLDLGWSSNQFENPERGFSFMYDGPLLMTLSGDSEAVPFTAYTIVNEWEEDSIVSILENYGEEKYAWKITQAILKERKNNSITSTLQLANIIFQVVPERYRNRKIHPATKTFQALRIAVNDEMGALHEVLEKGFNLLSTGGRMAIITFHSVEDRVVKNFFRKKKQEGSARLLTKKPQTASKDELEKNKRARSAKLRVLIKK